MYKTWIINNNNNNNEQIREREEVWVAIGFAWLAATAAYGVMEDNWSVDRVYLNEEYGWLWDFVVVSKVWSLKCLMLCFLFFCPSRQSLMLYMVLENRLLFTFRVTLLYIDVFFDSLYYFILIFFALLSS